MMTWAGYCHHCRRFSFLDLLIESLFLFFEIDIAVEPSSREARVEGIRRASKRALRVHFVHAFIPKCVPT